MTPLVSIIVPNYNHEKFLNQRFKSIFSQSFQNFEVIILDDCSSDQSTSVINIFRDNLKVTKVVYNEVNSGSPFLQWKKGIELAKGKYIWIAESDDSCELNFLEVAISRLEEDKSDLFYACSWQVNEKGDVLGKLENWFEDLDPQRWNSSYKNSASDEVRQFLIRKNTIVNASAVVFQNRKTLIKYLDNISCFRYCGDWMFWLQYLKDSYKLSYSVSTVNYFRFHESTTRFNSGSNRNREIIAIYKWICNNISDLKNKKLLLSYFTNVHLILYPRRKIFLNVFEAIKNVGVSVDLLRVLYSRYSGDNRNKFKI